MTPQYEFNNLDMRWVWNLFGVTCVGLGTTGLFVPGMPATVFFILALYSFTKGANEKWRNRLLNHKVVGNTLRHWEEHKSISRKIKWISTVCIAGSTLFSAFVIPPVPVKAFVFALGIFGIWYVLTRPTTEELVVADQAGEFDPQAA